MADNRSIEILPPASREGRADAALNLMPRPPTDLAVPFIWRSVFHHRAITRDWEAYTRAQESRRAAVEEHTRLGVAFEQFAHQQLRLESLPTTLETHKLRIEADLVRSKLELAREKAKLTEAEGQLLKAERRLEDTRHELNREAAEQPEKSALEQEFERAVADPDKHLRLFLTWRKDYEAQVARGAIPKEVAEQTLVNFDAFIDRFTRADIV